MKRFFSAILILMLMALVIPTAFAYEEPAVSTNINDHWYVNAQRWNDPINSYLCPDGEGFLRVEHIDGSLHIEQYDADCAFVSGQQLALELPLFGGIYLCDDYNFVVVGQSNAEENDETEVIRIIRYSKDWQRQASAGLYGANTTIPFDAGTVRFDRSGNILYIRTSHEMYTSDDGYNHQANVMVALRISDMTITDQLTKVWNSSYGYVSHSFNQFVRVDGTTLLAADHGDAHPRSVALFKYGQPAGSETFYSKTTMVNALPIIDGTGHYNDTGVSAGGFEFSSSHYLIAGNSGDQTVSANLMNVQRNIFVTATPKDNFTDEGTTCRWLTNHAEGAGVSVSPPHLLKLSSDRFFLIWTEDGVLHYCFLDGTGAPEGEIYTAEGALSDCVPVCDGQRIVWYVTNADAPVFYAIDLAEPGTVTNPHAHHYASVTTLPTCTEGGCTTYTCDICGHSYTDGYTEALGHDWQEATCSKPGSCSRCDATQGQALGHAYGEWIVESEATCTTGGSEYRLCQRCGAKSVSATAPLGHQTVVETQDPTCTEAGYTTSYCLRCDYHGEYEYTDPLGHSLSDWVVETEATCTDPGWKERSCSRCGLVETESIQALGHSYGSVITAPTCTEQGFTTYICTVCDHRYADHYTAPTGHSFGDWETTKASTCIEAGEESRKCRTCQHTETRAAALGDHHYESAVTGPTCTEKGFTAYTCTVCGAGYLDSYTDALGHDWDDGTVIREATEEEDGEAVFTCRTCGATENRTIPSPAHSHNYLPTVTDPTCTDAGYTTYTCRCGDSYISDSVPALGHTYADGKCIRCQVRKPALEGVCRIAGSNRVFTAFGIADALKETLGIQKFDAVVVASGMNFPDALTGSYLAAVKDAPILLTYEAVHADVVAYITQNMADDGIVYVLGGESAVSADFISRLEGLGIRCKRLAGADRFGTNLAILEEAGVSQGQDILVCTAMGFADSLSASATGKPILLVHGSLTEDQKAFLTRAKGNLTIIGGEGAVSANLEAALRAYGTVNRLKGTNRFQSSALASLRFFPGATGAVLAYAWNYPDGLCGGPLACALGVPLILTDSSDITAAMYANERHIESGFVLGGNALISDDAVRTIFAMAAEDSITQK